MGDKSKLYCIYTNQRCDDSGIEALKLYLPTDGGYINYNVVHSLMKSTNCDIWRLSVVYFCNYELERVRPLTRGGAEWEMAIKIKGRPDFIGGYAHGDEVFKRIKLTVDGEKREIGDICEKTAFNELIFEVWSVGYDPIDSETESLLHYKKIIVNESGITVEQRVEWLNDYALDNSYMAMMPPLKAETDHYFTDKDSTVRDIPERVLLTETGDIKSLYLFGKCGYTFVLQALKYLNDAEGRNTYYISDNGGVPYNKMYFLLNHRGNAIKGEAWETVTGYAVRKND